MDHARMRHRGALLLVSADVVFVGAALLAFWTHVSLLLGTTAAFVVAVAGIMDRRRGAIDPLMQEALDRALAACMASLVLALIVVGLPYVSKETLSLWESRVYWITSLSVAGIGMLAWNRAIVQGLTDRPCHDKTLFHAGVVALAVIMVAVGQEADVTAMLVRGTIVEAMDLRFAPLLMGAGVLPWAVELWRDARA